MTGMHAKILISGDGSQRELLKQAIVSNDKDLAVEVADNREEMLNRMQAGSYDIVFFMEDLNRSGEKNPKADNRFPIQTVYIGMQEAGEDENPLAGDSFISHMCRSLEERNNLTILKMGDKYAVYDPIGSLWAGFAPMGDIVHALLSRAVYLRRTHRMKSVMIGDMADVWNIMQDKYDLYLFAEYARKAAKVFQDTIPHKGTKFLGNASMRDKVNGIVAWMSKRGIDKNSLGTDSFIPARLARGGLRILPDNNVTDNSVWYWTDYVHDREKKEKPSRDTAIQLILYDKLPNINYMVHSHCYVEGAIFTQHPVPCGAIEEAGEILSVIEDKNATFITLNLIGHGCIVMSDDIEKMEQVKFITRQHPEPMF